MKAIEDQRHTFMLDCFTAGHKLGTLEEIDKINIEEEIRKKSTSFKKEKSSVGSLKRHGHKKFHGHRSNH